MNTRLLMIVLVATGLLFGTAFGASAQDTLPNAAQFFSIRAATKLRPTDTMDGPLSPGHILHIVFALKIPNWTKLKAFLSQPNHPVLTPAQFEAMYSPPTYAANTVATFLDEAGFSNVSITPNRLLVTGDAPAGTASAALETSFSKVLTVRGRKAFANTSPIQLPVSLQTIVLAVGGVQDVYRSHTAIVISGSPSAPQADASGGSLVYHNPTQFPIIYGASALPAASAVPVGIITFGDMTQVLSDLNKFIQDNSLPPVTVQVVGSGSSTGDVNEADLDSEVTVAMGGVQNLILYDATDSTQSDLEADYNAVVSADAVAVIDDPMTECETDDTVELEVKSDDQIFSEADAQGQTFAVASGDNGAYPCGATQNGTYGSTVGDDWPASSPYVLAVGGTDLYTTNSTAWNSETAWAYSGGGPSTLPSSYDDSTQTWQIGVGSNTASSQRGVADVAFDADNTSGANIIYDGALEEGVGGTSLASPIFVGAWARILEEDGTDIGFAAPLLYYGPAAVDYSDDFHDVTSGSNGKYSAEAGWDYPTGFGSMLVSNVASNIISLADLPGTPSLKDYFISGNSAAAEYELEWSSVTNASYYQLWYYTGGSDDYVYWTNIYGTKDEVSVPRDSATWEVRGCGSSLCGPFSNPVFLAYRP